MLPTTSYADLVSNFIFSRSQVFFTDWYHRHFIITNFLSYPPMAEYIQSIESSYFVFSIAVAISLAADSYANVSPDVQATCEMLLFDSTVLANKTVCYVDFLRSNPPSLNIANIFRFNHNIYVKWEELISIDTQTVQTVFRHQIDITYLLPPTPEFTTWYKEVFLYMHDSNIRMGLSVVACDMDNTPIVIFFDDATEDNIAPKFYDFVNSRHYPTHFPRSDVLFPAYLS